MWVKHIMGGTHTKKTTNLAELPNLPTSYLRIISRLARAHDQTRFSVCVAQFEKPPTRRYLHRSCRRKCAVGLRPLEREVLIFFVWKWVRGIRPNDCTYQVGVWKLAKYMCAQIGTGLQSAPSLEAIMWVSTLFSSAVILKNVTEWLGVEKLLVP